MKSTQFSKFRTPGTVGAIFVWHLLAFATFATFAFYTNPLSAAISDQKFKISAKIRKPTFSLHEKGV